MGYLRVFDGLAKLGFPPKAGFRCQNPFFLGLAQKPGFCPATHFFQDMEVIGIYIYIYIFPLLLNPPQNNRN